MNLKKITNRVRIKDDFNTQVVGQQKFTYGELQAAFETLEDKVYNDKSNLPEYTYDIRNGYSLQSDNDPEYCYNYDWGAFEMTYENFVTELANIPDEISIADMEVYFNDVRDKDSRNWWADTDDHGIFIENGRITEVY